MSYCFGLFLVLSRICHWAEALLEQIRSALKETSDSVRHRERRDTPTHDQQSKYFNDSHIHELVVSSIIYMYTVVTAIMYYT